MPDEELTHWGRGDRSSSKPTKRSMPTPAWFTSQTETITTCRASSRIYLHYCTHQNSCIGPDSNRQMIIDVVIAKAQALYTFEHAKGQ